MIFTKYTNTWQHWFDFSKHRRFHLSLFCRVMNSNDSMIAIECHHSTASLDCNRFAISLKTYFCCEQIDYLNDTLVTNRKLNKEQFSFLFFLCGLFETCFYVYICHNTQSNEDEKKRKHSPDSSCCTDQLDFYNRFSAHQTQSREILRKILKMHPKWAH